MIEEGEISKNALLSDDEIAVKAMRLGYQWHYPGRIGIQQILDESFSCDWKRRLIITELIVHYGLGRYADANKSDLMIGIESAKALQTEDPIGYIKKLKQESKRPIVKATNAIIGNNNSGNNQGRDLNNLSPTINTQPQHAQPKQNPIKKTDHGIWDKIKYISVIIGGLGAAIASAVAIGKYLGWWSF